jgi:hypothetical protein
MPARPSRPSSATGSQADPDVSGTPWAADGLLVGLVGAAVVAAFFAVVDLVEAGRLFWTPYVLGASVLLGRVPEAGEPIAPVLVVGYTALHAAVFVAVASFAAFPILTGSVPPGPVSTRALLVAALFFLALEAIFLGFRALVAPGSAGLLGFGRVALANALASAAMAGLLHLRAERRERAARR